MSHFLSSEITFQQLMVGKKKSFCSGNFSLLVFNLFVVGMLIVATP